MTIRCPYGGHPISAKLAKPPGRYRVRCPMCDGVIILTIPADPNAEWGVDVPRSEQPAESAADEGAAPGMTEVVRAAEAADLNRPPAPAPEAPAPVRLGGYEIIKRLGRGGMGSVYLARQVSLDRPVALKVMNTRWASDPVFVARFTREAYAAAQLVHHNIVQIYDIGFEGGLPYFSMEYVEGQSLGDLVKRQGKLDVELAVGYILQAARGLKFAHDRGMIHRDVKPDNLLLNRQGVVKVADLGLVKTPAAVAEEAAPPAPGSPAGLRSLPAEMTNARVALGSPAYMSPEQCRSAASVDARADVYSLGCTLYVLLTGRPPFRGTTALEVMTQHLTDAPVPPDAIVSGVPKEISAVLLRMLAKRPEDRFADMGEVIAALEGWLASRGAGGLVPQEEQMATLERCVAEFNDAPAAQMRSWLVVGFVAAAALLIVVGLAVGRPKLAGAALGLLVLTPLAYFVVHGLARRTYVFGKARELVRGSSLVDALTGLAGLLLFALLLYFLGLLGYWVGAAALGVLLALTLYFVADRQAAAERAPAIEQCENMLKRMRLQGLDEGALRLFVARYAGRRWEEFYEALFGYEAKLEARAALAAEPGVPREKFAPWRDRVVAWIDGVQSARRAARERKHLQAVEAKSLEARGATKEQARAEAAAAAEALVGQAEEIKSAEAERPPAPPPPTPSPAPASAPAATPTPAEASSPAPIPAAEPPPRPRVSVKDMLAGARPRAKVRPGPSPLKAAGELVFGRVLGPRVRFILSAILIAGGVMWASQNVSRQEEAYEEKMRDIGNAVTDVNEIEKVPGMLEALLDPRQRWEPLRLSYVPEALTDWFDHVNPLLAGLLLLLSLPFREPVPVALMLAGAAVAFAGHHLGMPRVGPVEPYQGALILGTAIGILGFAVARK